MIELLLTVGILSPSLLGVLIHMRNASQQEFDTDRLVYELVFPKGLTQKQVEAAIRSIGSNLNDNKFKGDPSIALEVISSPRGIRHLIRVPSRDAEYVMGQLEGHLPGIDATPIEKLPDIGYDFGASLAMSDPARTIPVSNVLDYAVKILKSLETADKEVVTLQYVITHTARVKVLNSDSVVPKSSPRFRDYLFGTNVATRDEVQDRQVKVSDQNYGAIGRIAAKAGSEARAHELVMKVLRALRSESSGTNRIEAQEIPYKKLDELVNGAVTPPRRSMQFTVAELAAFIGWPIGDPQIPGLARGSARRIAPTESVAREGRLLGWSNIPGSTRPIAQAYEYADRNTLFVGMIGSGKSVGMGNFIYDDLHGGHGCIVIDASSSRSAQSLSSRALEYIPAHRLNDVIHIDVVGNADHSVSFNPLDQGHGLGSVDLIEGVMTALYPDIANGVSVRDLLHHGLWTIVEHGGLSLVDLGALIRPKVSERQWADNVIANVKDPELREFWERMADTGRGNPRKQAEWDRYTDPLFRRLWQLTGRPEIRNMIGQTNNALNWEEVLTQRKVVIISLAGLPADSAELLGSMLVQTLWTTAQRLTPDKGTGTGLFLDEFQAAVNIKEGVGDLLNRGRKHGLWMTLGTQFLSDLPAPTKNAILNNVGTRVVYRTSADEAYMWRKQFGSDQLNETDFQNGREYEAIAQILDSSGRSTVTLKARPPANPTGYSERAIELSRQRFGRPVEHVREEIKNRRRPEPSKRPEPLHKPPGDGGTFELDG